MQTRKLSEQISINAAKFSRSYVACYKADCDGRPYHAGTLTGIDLGHQIVLVTAKHVLEKDNANPCDEDNVLYAFVGGKIDQLNRLQTAILPLPNGKLLDISVFVPETHDPGQIVSAPIPLSAVMASPTTSTHYLAACGFPETKNRRKGKELSSRPYGYFGKAKNIAARHHCDYDPSFHFAIEINLKKTYRGNLKEVIAPCPQGISGGPVFVTHDFAPNTQIDCMLAGIVIARDPESKHLIGVHAGVIVDIAHELFGK
ncbi:hypothetical protein [Xanthomonas sp. 3307]|uniref:hypothetical protein n=1 Tax=Xanthomonas sp. 3307 TaxID=3035316 RepID=UPI001607716B|nr:hypothetical protein [Xanthomonas sp. 3307]MBB5943876.1 hypothetical protein [Xanthomonas sp. 3307]